jgi:ATP-dependent helicase/nuclease subunit B
VTLTIRTSSYGAALFAALTDVVATLKGDDPITPVTVLVPSNTTGLSVRRHLARGVGGRPGVAAVEVTTIERFAEGLASDLVGARRPATTTIRSAAWRAALDDDPGVFAEVAGHSATVRALVRSEATLRDLDDATVDLVSRANPLAGETVALMQRALAKRPSWYDVSDLLAAAVSVIGPGSAVVLFAPAPLRNREATLIRATHAHRDVVLLAALTGSTAADRVLIESLATAGLEVQAAPDPAPRAGAVIHASDSDDEVRAVVREVLTRLETTPAERIAVLSGSWSPYGRLLHEHLAAAGITFNGPGVLSVADRATSRGFLSLLRMGADGISREALFIALGQLRRNADIPTGFWEFIARESGVVDPEDWSTRLGAHLDKLERRRDAIDDEDETRRERITRDIEQTEALRDFVVGLEAEFAEARAMDSWHDLAAWAEALRRRFLPADDEIARMPPGEQYALVAIDTAIAEAASLAALQPRASISTLIDTLEAGLDAARPRVGRFGEGVFVAPLSAAGVLDVDAVFVVGLAEDAYPGRAALDPILPDSLRTAHRPALRDARDDVAEKERLLLAAFGSASDIVASFPRGDLRRSTGRIPSRWLVPTLQALSGIGDVTATTWERAAGPRIRAVHSHWGETRATSSPATDREWRLRALASGGSLDDGEIADALELLEARRRRDFTRFDGDLRHVAAGLPDFAAGSALVAPTTLERYAGCPHAFLLQDVLRVRPIEEPEESVVMTPADVGNLMHEAFDVFFRSLGDSAPGYGESWSDEHQAALRDGALRIADEYEARGLTGHPRMWERERDSIVRDLDRMLIDDSARRAVADSRVVASELEFGDATPARVGVASGTVLMKGKIDKVDERRDGRLEVTDLKSGKPTSFTGISNDAVVAGTKLQLPAYAVAASQAFDGADVALTEYRFIRVRPEIKAIGIELTAEVTERYAAALETLTSSIAAGLFPAKAPEESYFAYVRCRYCNPDGVGHGEVRARYEHKRDDPALAGLIALIDPQVTAGEEGE